MVLAAVRGGASRSHPYVSLIDADPARLPRTLIVVAECDPLRDEGIAYADRLRTAGNDVTLVCYDGAFHGFLSAGDVLEVADVAARRTCIWIKEKLAQTTASDQRPAVAEDSTQFPQARRAVGAGTAKEEKHMSAQSNKDLVLSMVATVVAPEAVTDDFEFAIQADAWSACRQPCADPRNPNCGPGSNKGTFRFPDDGPAGDGLRQTVRS